MADNDELLYLLIGLNVRERRENDGLTQTALAELAGIGRTTLNMVENGNQRVHLNTLYRIAFVLGCTVGDLLPPPDPGLLAPQRDFRKWHKQQRHERKGNV